MRTQKATRKHQNPNFNKYTDIQNLKHYPELFKPTDIVVVTEKLHGTSARYGWVPTVTDTLWKKIKKFFGKLPAYEFCYGSRNVQIHNKSNYGGYYGQDDTGKDVYTKIAMQNALEVALYLGEEVYGEIVGAGIQTGYSYGHAPGQHTFFAYDAKINGRWLDYHEFVNFCVNRDICTVPFLYKGPFDKEYISSLRNGDSMIGGQKVREGIVVQSEKEEKCVIGRKILKYVSDEYLLGEQTDFH
jgi:RNA ligase (TIGR02306 family)